MQNISLYCIERTPHLSMLFTGFEALRREGVLTYKTEIDPDNREKLPSPHLLRAQVGEKRVIFDLCDGYIDKDEMATVLRHCDMYFKRSFSTARNRVFSPVLRRKLHPLGMYYPVSYPGNPMDEKPGEKKLSFQQLFHAAESSYFTRERFEAEPQPNWTPGILFQPCLWDVSEYRETEPSYYKSVEKLNHDRIQLVIELKRNYSNRFVGGVQYSPLAMRLCPELVVPAPGTRRKSYLKTMQQTEICIGSNGLRDSIGWKTAEYVAASRAIVTERFHYEVTGDFTEGKNFLGFDSVEECLAQLEILIKSPEKVFAMQKENEAYYRAYLRPDMLVRNALAKLWEG